MIKMRYNILLTAIGSFSADCVVREFKKAGHNVIGCDIYPSEWHAVSKDCDSVYRVPLAINKNEYISSIINICKIKKIQYIYPLTDVEIDVFNEYRDIFEEKGIVLCMPSSHFLSYARNKYILFKRFENDINVPSIRTFLTQTDNIPLLLPCIAKPYNGRSSEGLCKINTEEEFNRIANTSGYIIQEMIPGSVYTVDYIRSDKLNVDFSIPREELLRTKNGAGITVRISNDQSLIKLVSYIGSSLKLNGVVNMEFIKNSDKYYLIDINPRFSAGVAFSVKSGYNMILNSLNCYTNGNIEIGEKYYCGLMTKRYYEEIL